MWVWLIQILCKSFSSSNTRKQVECKCVFVRKYLRVRLFVAKTRVWNIVVLTYVYVRACVYAGQNKVPKQRRMYVREKLTLRIIQRKGKWPVKKRKLFLKKWNIQVTISRDQLQMQVFFCAWDKNKIRGRSWTHWHVTILSNQVLEIIWFIFAPNYLFRL